MTTNKIELFIVDRDPIFRLGLSVALETFPDLVIIAQEDTAIAALGKLAQGMIPDILVLEYNFIALENDSFTAPEFCQKLHQIYPQLPIFLLTSGLNNQELSIFKNLGVKGYVTKGSSLETIVYALRQVGEGKTYWELSDIYSEKNGWFKNALSRLAEPGKQQIETNIENITNELNREQLSYIDKLFLLGRKRELTVARWLANKIAPQDNNVVSSQTQKTQVLPNSKPNKVKLPPKIMLAVIDDDKIVAKVFKQVIAKISLGTVNKTNFFLEIDVLQPDKRQELLYLIVNTLGEILKITPVDQEINPIILLKELWQKCTINFLLKNSQNNNFLETIDINLILEQEFDDVQSNLLLSIYLLDDLLEYLLKEKSINIDNVLYRQESPEAINRALIILENVLINIANGVMQVILNNFADLEIFKYYLYDDIYRSSREIARFRNEISWRYRQDKYWEHPRNIFESRYRFFVLNNGNIETLYLYASRVEELYQLEGLPWLTTIILESRDAIAPRLQSIFSLVGSSFVFVLTQVIGKGIGLIVKGVLQGIGSTLQDVRKK